MADTLGGTMKCLGRNLEDICCITSDWVCPFLEEYTQPGFRWTCGLRRELGDWDSVLKDERYINGPEKKLARFKVNCKDWPDETLGHGCAKCGANK